MIYILLFSVVFSSVINPGISYSAVTVRLDAATATLLRKGLNAANPGEVFKVGKSRTGGAGASEAKSQTWRFYGVDGQSAYLLELPKEGAEVRILNPVPVLPKDEIVLDIRSIDELCSAIPGTSKRRLPSRHRRRSRSHSSKAPPAPFPPAASAPAPPQVSVPKAKLDELPDGVFSQIISFLPAKASARLSQGSRQLRVQAARGRTTRLEKFADVGQSADDVYPSLLFGEAPPADWTAIERAHIQNAARYYLDHQDPEKAYQLLRKNGAFPPRSTDLSADMLLVEAAIATGRTQQALAALRGSLLHLRRNPDHPQYQKLLLFHEQIKMRNHGRSSIPDELDDDALIYQAVALFAEKPVAERARDSFITLGNEALESAHVSDFQKHQIAYRLGESHMLQENWDEALRHFRYVIDNANPHLPYYKDSLERLFDINVRRHAHQENLVTVYELLHKKHIPHYHKNVLQNLMLRRYGGLSEQQLVLASEAGPSTSHLAAYLQLEKARLALLEFQTDGAATALEQLSGATRIEDFSDELKAAARRYQEIVNLQNLQRTAVIDSERARAGLREALERDAASLSEELPLLRAHHLAQRSLVYTRLKDYTAAMNDLWEVLKEYRWQQMETRFEWSKSPFEEVFKPSYQALVESVATASLNQKQKYQLQLLEATLAKVSKASDVAWRVYELDEAVTSGTFSKEQQVYADLLRARLTSSLKGIEETTDAYRKVWAQEERLPPYERMRAHRVLANRYRERFQHEDEVQHLRLALRQKHLSIEDRIDMRVHLANALRRTRDPDDFPEIVELFSSALRDQKFYEGRIRDYSKAELQSTRWAFARALGQYARQEKSYAHAHQSFRNYQLAVELAEKPSKKSSVLAEWVGPEFEAYWHDPWGYSIFDAKAIHEFFDDAYKSYFHVEEDAAVSHAKAAIRFADLGMRKARKQPLVEASEAFSQHYSLAKDWQSRWSPSEQALYDLKETADRYRLWGISWKSEQIEGNIVPPLEKALRSGELNGRDLSDAHESLAQVYERLGELKLREKESHQAEAFLKRALEHDAEVQHRRRSHINTQLALSYYAQKKYRPARELLLDLDAVNPEQLDPLLRKRRLGILGDLAMQRKDYVDAVAQYEAAEAVEDLGRVSYSYAGSLKTARRRRQVERLQHAVRSSLPHRRHTDGYSKLGGVD